MKVLLLAALFSSVLSAQVNLSSKEAYEELSKVYWESGKKSVEDIPDNILYAGKCITKLGDVYTFALGTVISKDKPDLGPLFPKKKYKKLFVDFQSSFNKKNHLTMNIEDAKTHHSDKLQDFSYISTTEEDDTSLIKEDDLKGIYIRYNSEIGFIVRFKVFNDIDYVYEPGNIPNYYTDKFCYSYKQYQL